MPRPRVALLSRERIADAAIDLADSGERFGVNALARRLGVTPSSLYNHVDGKDAIVVLMCGRLVDRYFPSPDPEPGRWDEFVRATLKGQRLLYQEHPLIAPLVVGRTIDDPRVIAHYDALTTALVGAGFGEDEVLPIVVIIDAFGLGFGLAASAEDSLWSIPEETQTLGRLAAAVPHGVDHADRTFRIGLDVLIDSLRARLARSSAH